MHDRAMMLKSPIKVGVDKHGSMWDISNEKRQKQNAKYSNYIESPWYYF